MPRHFGGAAGMPRPPRRRQAAPLALLLWHAVVVAGLFAAPAAADFAANSTQLPIGPRRVISWGFASTARNTPPPSALLRDAVAVAAGGYHTVALTSGGRRAALLL